MTTTSPAPVLQELRAHQHAAPLIAAARGHVLAASRAKNTRLVSDGRRAVLDGAEPPAELSGIDPGELTTEWGDALSVLENGARTRADQQLLAGLVALSLSEVEGERLTAADLVWLAAYTGCDALSLIDEAAGNRAGSLWRGVFEVYEAARADLGRRAEVFVAAAALGASSHPEAAAFAEAAAADADTEPLIAAVLVRRVAATNEKLSGELVPRSYGPVATAVLAVTLMLFVLRGARVIGKLAFAYRKPAEVRLSPRGLELSARTELLGRVLRDHSVVVPLGSLARVTREVRYARTGMYLGLAALVIGSYSGMGLLVDGLRAPGGSPPWLGLAVLLIVLGIVIDFVLSSLSDGVRGRCRLLVVPVKGKALCIGGLDPKSADSMLTAIARRSAGAAVAVAQPAS